MSSHKNTQNIKVVKRAYGKNQKHLNIDFKNMDTKRQEEFLFEVPAGIQNRLHYPLSVIPEYSLPYLKIASFDITDELLETFNEIIKKFPLPDIDKDWFPSSTAFWDLLFEDSAKNGTFSNSARGRVYRNLLAHMVELGLLSAEKENENTKYSVTELGFSISVMGHALYEYALENLSDFGKKNSVMNNYPTEFKYLETDSVMLFNLSKQNNTAYFCSPYDVKTKRFIPVWSKMVILQNGTLPWLNESSNLKGIDGIKSGNYKDAFYTKIERLKNADLTLGPFLRNKTSHGYLTAFQSDNNELYFCSIAAHNLKYFTEKFGKDIELRINKEETVKESNALIKSMVNAAKYPLSFNPKEKAMTADISVVKAGKLIGSFTADVTTNRMNYTFDSLFGTGNNSYKTILKKGNAAIPVFQRLFKI